MNSSSSDAPRRHTDLLSEGDLNTSPNREAWQARTLTDGTRALLEEDARYFLRQGLSSPCLNVVEEVDGIWLVDTDGRRYMDFHGNWVHQVGYGHPKVVRAITDQLQRLSFSPRRYTNRTAIELARRLATLAPGDLDKVLFAPGGALAMGMALKLARMATSRHKTISMWDSFHGASLDAISIGGEAMFRKGAGPLLPGTEHAPPPSPHNCPFKCGQECSLACADYIEYMLEKEGDVGAVVAETVRSIPYIPPKAYWKKVRAACDRHGALLILDEIPHAFGRTGTMFTVEHYDIVPDILVLGKGLGGGIMPLAAIVARSHLDNVAPERALGHYTHEKSPVAAAAALAMLDVLEEENLPARAARLGRAARAYLDSKATTRTHIRDVRGLGLMLGVELAHNEMADRAMYHALDLGLSFKVTMGNVLLLLPPLTIEENDLYRALDIVVEAADRAAAF